MSEAVLLPAIFKGATEVTTLASTDRLMVISSDGTPKKIGKDILTDTLTFNAKANTWYQIMVGSLGGTASVGSLLIVSDPVSQEALSLDWCISRSSSVERQDLHIFNPPIDRYPRIILSNLRIRIPPTAGKSFYLDLYVTDQKRISVKLGQSFNAALSLIENPQVDSTYAIMEYDLSVFGGGVKRYLPTFYEITEKGGCQHERTVEYLITTHSASRPRDPFLCDSPDATGIDAGSSNSTEYLHPCDSDRRCSRLQPSHHSRSVEPPWRQLYQRPGKFQTLHGDNRGIPPILQSLSAHPRTRRKNGHPLRRQVLRRLGMVRVARSLTTAGKEVAA